MKRIGKLRKFFMILLSVVMMSSPVFLSGCFGNYGGNSNTNKDDTNFTVITIQTISKTIVLHTNQVQLTEKIMMIQLKSKTVKLHLKFKQDCLK